MLLITGVLLFLVSKQTDLQGITQQRIDEIEKSVLQEIAADNSFRTDIVSGNVQLEEDYNDGQGNGMISSADEIYTFVQSKIPSGFNFALRICKLEDACPLDPFPAEDREIYSRSIAITTNIELYEPKQIRIFMWSE